MTLPSCIHVLNLDTVGGVEALYIHFLEEAFKRQETYHHTIVSGRPPHPVFMKTFQKLHIKPYLERYLLRTKIPSCFSRFISFRRSIIDGIVNPIAWVYWNRIEEGKAQERAIYYEHGASWMAKVSKKNQLFLQGCKRILANSQAAKTMLKEKWGILQDIHVIPNPLRPDIHLATIPKTLSAMKPLSLGIIGRLTPIKGVQIALHTLKDLLDNGLSCTLSIAGSGSEEESLKKLSQSLGISSQIIWMGSIEDVTSFYDSIDLLLIPSIREPLGLVAIEASSRGVPVIASNIDGLPEAIIQDKTGILLQPTLALDELLLGKEGLPDYVVEPLTQTLKKPLFVDPKDFSKTIQHLMNTPSRYQELSTESIMHAQSKANFSEYVTTLLHECSSLQECSSLLEES